MIDKFRKLLAISALTIAPGILPLFGADSDPMHISVPFAFKAGRINLPPGDYTVTEENSGVVVIKGVRGNAILLTTAGSDSNPGAGVSFARDEQGYVLKSVHAWGKTTCNLLPVTQ